MQIDDQHTSVYDFVTDGTPTDVVARYASLKTQALHADYGDLDRNIVVIDTETTGVSERKDELTQIAAARLERGEITEWFVTFVNPGKPIPDEISHLTNIFDTDVADAPTPVEACEQLVRFVGDATLVAHNAAFDRHFVTKNAGGACLKENLWIDSLDLARIALPRLKSHRLIDLVHAFDAPISTHRADADVEALCAVYRILLAAVSDMPNDLVEYISKLAPIEEWSTGAVFALVAAQQREHATSAAGEKAETFPFSLSAMRRSRFSQANQPKPASENNTPNAQSEDLPMEFPAAEEIEAAFSSDGLVGRLYNDFEPRDEQVVMAKEVLKAFSTSTNLVVEAGTGVGKSMAYLLPSALGALRSGSRIGVATKTNALLDQIVYKELPLLKSTLADAGVGDLSYVALKGFSHYPCMRKVSHIVSDGARMVNVTGKDVSQAPSIAALLSFIEQTEYDDMDGLKLDYRVLPRYAITTTSRECLKRKCPFFGPQCFVHGLRKRAESANVLVTNHSLFFCDLAAEGFLLPPTRYWVVDEAHGAEAEARRALAVKLDAAEIVRLANRLAATDAKRNPFVRLERRAPMNEATMPEASSLFYGLTEKAAKAGRAFSGDAIAFSHHMKDLVAWDTNRQNRNYENIELWINDEVRGSQQFAGLREYGKKFQESAEKLVAAASELVAFLEGVDGVADVQRDVATVVIDAKGMLQACDLILNKVDENYVYAAKLSRKPERVAECLEALIVNIGATLDETLYEKTHSVVYASATIAVGDDFKNFLGAMGLGETEGSRANTCMLGSSYDFDKNMQVLVLTDIPEPNQPGYLETLEDFLTQAHLAQNGSMLTLFTNRREMEECFGAVDPSLKEAGLRLVCQKWGVSTKGLRDDFLKDEHLSLFALKSFWEGFDAPGATLKGVVIPKLPFAKPTDPLSCERAVRDSSAWSHYTLPQAVIEVKQAAGRLIRSQTDSGTLVLADKRLVTKGYGRVFLRSLPSKNIVKCTRAEAIEALRRGVAGSAIQ